LAPTFTPFCEERIVLASTYLLPASRRLIVSKELASNEGWVRLRDAALRTPYYSSRYPQLTALTEVKPVRPAEVYARFAEFENQHAWKVVSPVLGAHWSRRRNTVALAPWFRLNGIRVLKSFSPEELATLQPDALAGPVATLRALASLVLTGGYRIPSLRLGTIAFAGVNCRLPDDSDREVIWKAFQLPLFTQMRGFHGELLAMECEAQDGLHINPKTAIFESTDDGLLVTSLANFRFPVLRLITGLQARTENRPCACGSTAPRLTCLRPASL
jgi:hypothetical protein